MSKEDQNYEKYTFRNQIAFICIALILLIKLITNLENRF